MECNVVLAVVTEGCSNCKEFLNFWDNQKNNFDNLKLRLINFASYEGQGLSLKYDFIRVPAVIVNDKLLSAGPIDRVRLLNDFTQLNNN